MVAGQGGEQLYRVSRASSVVHADDPCAAFDAGSACHQARVLAFMRVELQQAAEEDLVGGREQDGVAKGCEGVEAREQLQGLLPRLVKIEPRVDDDLLRREPGDSGAGREHDKCVADVVDDAVVLRPGIGDAGAKPVVRGDHRAPAVAAAGR